VVELAVLDVGQGDTMVVSVPSTREAVVIDCVDVDAVFAYLQDRRIAHLRGLVLTHLHLDHYRHALQLLRNSEARLGLRCEQLFFQWDRAGSAANQARLLRDDDTHGDDGMADRVAARTRKYELAGLLAWADNNRRACKRLAREEDYTPFTGTFEHVLQVVHPWYGNLRSLSVDGLNDTSAVLRVQGKATSALLTGDIEGAAWERMTQDGVEELRANVLKFPHHGGWRTGNPAEVLECVQPEIVIVSVGTRGVHYDHPNQSVLEAVRARAPDVRLLCTQATAKCGPADEVQSDAVSAHEHRVDTFQGAVRRRRQGCPCAGDIIVSLGDAVDVLQPSIRFHQNHVILPLLPNHQCALLPEIAGGLP
jgi:hypothetical protein